MVKLFFFLFGFFCFVFGLTDFILYLNLLTMGYTFLDFILFVMLGLPGFLMILGFSIFTFIIFKEKRNDDGYNL